MIELPKRLAHRGASALAPENTLSALQLAAKLGASWVEFDVALTADQQVIVMHDESVTRTTDGCGAVHRLTWRQLRHLDAGSWFSPCYKGERIPLLSEWLDCAKMHSLSLNIECKARNSSAAEDLVKGVLECLSVTSFPIDRVLLSSSQIVCLQASYALKSDLTRALVCDAASQRDIATAKGLRCVSLNADYRRITKQKCESIHHEGMACLAWTVNSEPEMQALYRLGVDGVFSDIV